MSGTNQTAMAFPWGGDLNDCPTFDLGMTLRDYFAAKAMQARISDYESCKSIADHAKKFDVSFAEEVAAQSYDMADAMLKAREA